jgi:glutaredoxin
LFEALYQKQQLHKNSNHDAPTWTLNILDLDTLDSDGPLIQMELLMKTGQRTVPSVFIGGKHMGGNSDVQLLYQGGKLQSLLDQVARKHDTADQQRAHQQDYVSAL